MKNIPAASKKALAPDHPELAFLTKQGARREWKQRTKQKIKCS
jgi:hypothetical protein